MFLNDWKIDSIYEDEDGLEFYDDLALDKIKRGISLKAQGYSDEQIISKLNRMEAKVEKKAEPVQPINVSDYISPSSEEQPHLPYHPKHPVNEFCQHHHSMALALYRGCGR